MKHDLRPEIIHIEVPAKEAAEVPADKRAEEIVASISTYHLPDQSVRAELRRLITRALSTTTVAQPGLSEEYRAGMRDGQVVGYMARDAENLPAPSISDPRRGESIPLLSEQSSLCGDSHAVQSVSEQAQRAAEIDDEDNAFIRNFGGGTVEPLIPQGKIHAQKAMEKTVSILMYRPDALIRGQIAAIIEAELKGEDERWQRLIELCRKRRVETQKKRQLTNDEKQAIYFDGKDTGIAEVAAIIEAELSGKGED